MKRIHIFKSTIKCRNSFSLSNIPCDFSHNNTLRLIFFANIKIKNILDFKMGMRIKQFCLFIADSAVSTPTTSISLDFIILVKYPKPHQNSINVLQLYFFNRCNAIIFSVCNGALDCSHGSSKFCYIVSNSPINFPSRIT